MATVEGVQSAMGLLRACGVQAGPNMTDARAVSLLVEVWLDLLAGLDDAGLQAAVKAWLGQPGDAGRWWPTPGGLLALAPRRQVAVIAGPSNLDVVATEALRAMRRNYPNACPYCHRGNESHLAGCPVPHVEAVASSPA